MNHRSELPPGTLDLLILRTLALQPQHGLGISERVQQMSSDVLRDSAGMALHRLQRGWIKGNWARRKTTAAPNTMNSAGAGAGNSPPKRIRGRN